MYPPPQKIFHGPGPRKRSRGVAAKDAVRRPLGTPAVVVIRLAKKVLCASRRSISLSLRSKPPANLARSFILLLLSQRRSARGRPRGVTLSVRRMSDTGQEVYRRVNGGSPNRTESLSSLSGCCQSLPCFQAMKKQRRRRRRGGPGPFSAAQDSNPALLQRAEQPLVTAGLLCTCSTLWTVSD